MNTDNKLVSIIVPIYNTEDYLSACIDSILEQTYKNIQIILVDDQSTDRSPEICDDYMQKDGRIVVIHQKNTGVSGARNAGIDCATGDYIMFVDSDDELYPEAVEILVHDAFEYEADIVSAAKHVEDKRGKTDEISDKGKSYVLRGEELLLRSLEGEKNTNSACAKLFKKSLVSDIRFEEGKNINEDGFFVFQCGFKKPTMVQHNVPVYKYNYRQNSSSKQAFSEKYLSMLYFCEKKKELVADKYPQFIENACNMEVRTKLLFLEVLCRTTEKRYTVLQKDCIETVRRLYKYHKPINGHHKKLAWIIKYGFYPVYKTIIRLKYYR
ncbi:MAG: glycosyltransferase [Oscillospiraceae bacterium]|nr:glycosyltransferase [Oscillospiraceae bacterium]